MTTETIRHWTIGDVQVARIVEVELEDDIAMLFAGATPQFLQQFDWLRPHYATADGRMIINFQAFVLRSRGKTVMIDTCIGAGRQREFEVFCNLRTTFLDDLRTAGFPPEEVSAVLCTHLHFDHVGWNTQLVAGRWVPTFPQARYLFGRREWEHWKHLRETGGYHDMTHLIDAIDPVMEAGLVDFIDPDYQITDEVSLIPTPGHTPGHVSVLIRSRGYEAVITGDMMHHPVQLAVPEKPGNFDMDAEQATRTRREFIDRFADRPTLVIGSHFAGPTAGRIVRDGKACRLLTE